MRISTLLDRPVLLLGAGREGLATFRLLRTRGHTAPIQVLADQPAQGLPDGLLSVDGADLDAVLTPATVVVRSPGFAPHHGLRRRLDAWGGRQTTATRLLLEELQAADIATVGVTASKGKSTIATLTHELLLAAGRRAALVGNIGVPGLSRLDSILAERPIVVLELSSYQCADLAPDEGPALVVLGSLFPEHLDWHGTLHDYLAAKASLLSAAPAGACLMVHRVFEKL